MSDTTVPAKAAAPPAPPDTPQKLDDVLLAMDVVDTLRHRESIADQELNAEVREEKLIARLKEIYSAQGIEVPDRILKDGVKALDEQRFLYRPPDANRFGVKLARAYVNRRKWLPQTVVAASLVVVLVLGGMAWSGMQAASWQRMPAEIAKLSAEGQALAVEPAVDARIASIAAAANAAVQRNDKGAAKKQVELLKQTNQILGQDYDVRVYNKGDERSAVFRVNGKSAGNRSYYLIVEAIDAGGGKVKVPITNEETNKTETVDKWGQRVPFETYEKVRIDKQDDQIIQNNILGHKSIGYMGPTYTVTVDPGAITKW